MWYNKYSEREIKKKSVDSNLGHNYAQKQS